MCYHDEAPYKFNPEHPGASALLTSATKAHLIFSYLFIAKIPPLEQRDKLFYYALAEGHINEHFEGRPR
jgi:hypothetical protein